MTPRLTKYILHTPTVKQQAFLLLSCLDAFYGGPLTLDSHVLTPHGFVAIKDIHIGASILMPDGSVSKVIEIPYTGIEPVYRITFSDNTYVDASINHKWLVTTGDWKKTTNIWREKRTFELLLDYKLTRNRLKYKIPLVSNNIDFNKKEHIISPYTLGVLLGDGTITKRNPIKITNVSDEIYNRISNELYQGYHLTNKTGLLKNNYNISRKNTTEYTGANIYSNELNRMKLLGCTAEYKFIPDEYLIDSKENRLALLQGLMDTDGSSRKRCRGAEYTYSTISDKLRDGIIFLVQSLGGLATWKKEKNYCNRISININLDIFSLSRKKKNIAKRKIYRMIKNIEYLGKKETKCITVDHKDHLFITNSFVVTKNSAGGGKSDALLAAALQYVDIPGYDALLIRDTYKNLTKPEGLLDRANEWLMGSDARWNEKQKAWIFPSGATLSFGYLDAPRDHSSYQSSEYQFIGIDEAVNIRETHAKYMFSRLRKKMPESYLNDLKQLHPDIAESILNSYYEAYKNIPLRYRCASNPPNIEQYARGEWVKRKYVDPETKDKDVVFIPAKIIDNPHLNQKEYIKSLDKLDPITRAQLLTGDWDIKVKGQFFQRGWFKIIDSLPPTDEIVKTVRRWDLAATVSNDSNKEPAWTVGVRMHETKLDGWVIDSVIRLRETPLKIQKIIRQTADMDGKEVIVSMEQEPGSAGVSVIDTYRIKILPGFIFDGDKKQTSKISSAMAYAGQAEAGNIKLLRGYWNKLFLEEHEVFPGGVFKDQVDASCGAFNFLCEGVVPRATCI